MKHESEETFDARIHPYLDDELDPREAEEMERNMAADSILRRRVNAIRDLQQWMKATRPSPPPALADHVLEKITADAPQAKRPSDSRTEHEHRSGWRGWFGAWLHPAWVGAAGVAVIACLLLLTQRPADQTGIEGSRTPLSMGAATGDVVGGAPAGVDGADLVRHDFRLEVPGAQQVCLVGNFNRWKVCATPLQRVKENHWQISVELKRGRHEYMFVVDNEWVSDPRAAVQVDDGFGHRNSVLIL